MSAHHEEQRISAELLANRDRLEQIFDNCGDIIVDNWMFGPQLKHGAFSIYCQSFVEDSKNHFIKQTLQELVSHEIGMAESVTPELIRTFFNKHGTAMQPYVLVSTYDEAAAYVVSGCILIFFESWNQAICYRASSVVKRQVTEPVSEPVVQGPREGTIEDLDTNLAMIRQRVKTPQLKIEIILAGTMNKKKIVFCYLANVINPEVLDEFRERITGIEKFEVMDMAYVEDWIEEAPYSPFPQFRYTERTDAAAAALLDGKLIMLVENSPMILIGPAVFVDFLGTGEDYYSRTTYATLIRLLRVMAFVIALILPSIYIALTTFHTELIPTVLLLTILDTREGIPFPAFFEALIMEVSFELLREAGIRLPKPVGSAVSIVGALVIGQAAIMAKIASPTMIIVVALTGIASFAIPHYDMSIAIRIMRFPYMIAAALLGGFGIMAVFLLMLLHMICLESLGQPYMSSLAPMKLYDWRDIFIRVRLKNFLLSPRNRQIQRPRGGGRKG